jgi:hypothetical protein
MPADKSANVFRDNYVQLCGRAPVSDFAPIVRIPPKSDNPSGARGSSCLSLTPILAACVEVDRDIGWSGWDGEEHSESSGRP